MRIQTPRGEERLKRFVVVLASLTVAFAIAALHGAAAPPVGFMLSPSSLSYSTAAGSFEFQLVTVTTKGAVVIQNPATVTGDNAFFDTQAGSCWQNYGALGKKIPPHTSCTIQVGFHPTAPGSYSAVLTVYRCTSWHLDPNGLIFCDTLDGSQSVNLTGTGT
jgi:hypothetical protein